MKHYLYSTPILMFPDLRKQFDIEIDASDYDTNAVLTHNGHLVAYHSETLSNNFCRCPTYDKDMYSIM